jgi:predicted nucleic acid-binding protein
VNPAGRQLIIADTGPLIALAISGQLQVLQKLFERTLIPEAVLSELCINSSRPGAAALASALGAGWIKKVATTPPAKRLLHTLDQGEAEAITLAAHENLPLLIDEARGRTAARKEGIQIFGTGALLIQAKRQKLIPGVKPILDLMQDSGYRISTPLRKEILKRAGEPFE